MGWDEVAWHGMVEDGMGWNGMRRGEAGWDGIGWGGNGVTWGSMGWHEMRLDAWDCVGLDGTRWDSPGLDAGKVWVAPSWERTHGEVSSTSMIPSPVGGGCANAPASDFPPPTAVSKACGYHCHRIPHEPLLHIPKDERGRDVARGRHERR